MHLKKIFFICLVCICCTVKILANESEVENFEKTGELPTACKLDDVNTDSCLQKSFQQIAQHLKIGLPELNIPSLDPFVIEKTSFQFDEGILQGHVLLKNIHIYGLSDVLIDKVNFKLENGHMTMEHIAHIPNLYVEGLYKADMKLNEAKLTPKGYFNMTMSDVTITSHPEGDIYNGNNGYSYMHLTKFDIDPEISDMRIYANGLFPDPTLNALMLDFVNRYWRLIYKSIIPSARASWEPVMINAANELLSTIPIDLFLTSN